MALLHSSKYREEAISLESPKMPPRPADAPFELAYLYMEDRFTIADLAELEAETPKLAARIRAKGKRLKVYPDLEWYRENNPTYYQAVIDCKAAKKAVQERVRECNSLHAQALDEEQKQSDHNNLERSEIKMCLVNALKASGANLEDLLAECDIAAVGGGVGNYETGELLILFEACCGAEKREQLAASLPSPEESEEYRLARKAVDQKSRKIIWSIAAKKKCLKERLKSFCTLSAVFSK